MPSPYTAGPRNETVLFIESVLFQTMYTEFLAGFKSKAIESYRSLWNLPVLPGTDHPDDRIPILAADINVSSSSSRTASSVFLETSGDKMLDAFQMLIAVFPGPTGYCRPAPRSYTAFSFRPAVRSRNIRYCRQYPPLRSDMHRSGDLLSVSM